MSWSACNQSAYWELKTEYIVKERLSYYNQTIIYQITVSFCSTEAAESKIVPYSIKVLNNETDFKQPEGRTK